MRKFDIGDHVTLKKEGSPLMVVEVVGPWDREEATALSVKIGSPKAVRCTWFDADDVRHSEWFHVDSLDPCDGLPS